jgi:hypothetical protein
MIDHKTLRLSAVLLVVGFILMWWWASSIPTGQAHSGPRPATEHPSMTPTDHCTLNRLDRAIGLSSRASSASTSSPCGERRIERKKDERTA